MNLWLCFLMGIIVRVLWSITLWEIKQAMKEAIQESNHELTQ